MPAVGFLQAAVLIRAPETKNGFTGSFEPSQVIAVVLRNLSGAIGGFQGASLETSEEDGIIRAGYIRPHFRPGHQIFRRCAPQQTCAPALLLSPSPSGMSMEV